MTLRLSVLDQSVACAGRGEDDAIRDTVALAEHAEALGYDRFWVSEHHGLPTIVGSAPEVLMAAVAARTTRIRIGSAGVMLPHYSALKVAEAFRVLDALAPGRIDLGVGRAPGSDRRTAQALNPHVSGMAEDFPEQILDLQAWASSPTPGRRPVPAPSARPRCGCWAARTTAPSWPPTWGCRMRLPTSSWTARAWSRRCTCTARSTARARAIRGRRPRSASGRWLHRPRPRPASTR
jgi:luciferase family oxidoreductase group 1